MEIEVELKTESPLLEKKECFCGKEALRTVLIGDIKYNSGTEFDICGSPDCLDSAMDDEIERIERESKDTEQWDVLKFEMVRDRGEI